MVTANNPRMINLFMFFDILFRKIRLVNNNLAIFVISSYNVIITSEARIKLKFFGNEPRIYTERRLANLNFITKQILHFYHS